MKKTNQFRTIAYVSLDAFFASVERALHPELRDRPVVVCGNPHTRNIVACPSYDGRLAGVRTGMTIPEARHRLPRAHFVEGSFYQYEQFSREFYAILSRFTDHIEPVSLDEAYLELIGFESRYISAEMVAYEIQKTIARELEISASIGIASNKVTARAAAKAYKPRQVTNVPWGHEPEFLSPLSVTNLPTVGPRTAEVLGEYGVATIGDLADKPHTFIDEIFGEQSRWLWTIAHGIDNRPVVTPGRTKTITRSYTFPFATQDETLIHKHVDELVDAACTAIRTTQQIGSVLQIGMTTHWGEYKTKQLTISQPTNSTHQLINDAHALLNTLRTRSSVVTRLTVRIAQLERQSRYAPVFTVSFRKLHKIKTAIETVQRQFGFGHRLNYDRGG